MVNNIGRLKFLAVIALALIVIALGIGITPLPASAETADLPACYADQISVLTNSQMAIVGSAPQLGSFNLDWTHEGTNANDGPGLLFVRNINGSQMDAAYVFGGRLQVSGNGWKIDGNDVSGGTFKFTFAGDGNSLTGTLSASLNGPITSRVAGVRCKGA